MDFSSEINSSTPPCHLVICALAVRVWHSCDWIYPKECPRVFKCVLKNSITTFKRNIRRNLGNIMKNVSVKRIVASSEAQWNILKCCPSNNLMLESFLIGSTSNHCCTYLIEFTPVNRIIHSVIHCWFLLTTAHNFLLC